MRSQRRVAILVFAVLAGTRVEAGGFDDVTTLVKDAFLEQLKDTDTINNALAKYLEKQGIDGLSLEVKWFEGDTPGDDSGFGVAYSYEKQIADRVLRDDCEKICDIAGMDLSLATSGNLAFDKQSNPDDFLEIDLSTSLFRASGGPKAMDTAWKEEATQIEIDLTEALSQDALDAVQERAITHARKALANHTYQHIALELGYEANQDLSARQLTYGVRAAFDYKVLDDLNATSFSEASPISRLNILDYPFALTRFFTKSGDCEGGRCFVPRGRFPLVLIGFAAVDPKEDDRRKAAGGDLDIFPRFDAEAVFKTVAFELGGEKVYAGVAYRYFKEVGADRAVRQAGLDDFEHLTVTLGPGSGPFVRFTKGELPFDQRDQEAVEVGFKADFDQIRDFFF